ncbi:LysE/ArgO family amino acid transporter [Deinococcus yavapaiensis]|uniref:L-lysine exporter family protein LysE/ArgO n=1 Tax=Deinococcus yavapaiensis KR-236 TaxID=694435 RepID=A0A318S9U6_9DEIO|nr:LysE family transporter [Deinococcus yavapaiensis]PYE55008.1 L-lysine exporter family protein LysE/ArgO [Deinococcus yavapaiensis KR-236]
MRALLEGLLLGFGLIVAIGPQNAFVLRAGLRRRHAYVAALVSSLGDVALITVGVLGIGSLLAASPLLVRLATIGGALFLAWYGVGALRSALQPGRVDLDGNAPTSARDVALAAAGFSLLNFHAILDTVVLLGTVSARFEGPPRAEFAVGAMLASVTWFFALAFVASRLAFLFARPAAWRVLDFFVATVMFALAARLLLAA